MCRYAESHEDLAMALVNAFWQAEKDDYCSMVQQCLMHPSLLGSKSIDSYDWNAVASDLEGIMALASRKEEEGDFLSAAEIARWVMLLTCEEYEKDHPYGEQYGEMWWLRRKNLCEVVRKAQKMLTRLLITGDDIDDDSQRGLIKEIVPFCKPLKKTHICSMDDFLNDAQEKALSPKRYLSWLSKKVESTRGGYFKKPFFEKKLRLLDKMGQRQEAFETMTKYKYEDELLYQSICILIEWKEYEKALQLTDINPKNRVVFMKQYDERTMDILNLIGDRSRTIAVCKDRFHKLEWKNFYFKQLRSILAPQEWSDFLDETLANADTIFFSDYDGVEAQIYAERGEYDKIVIACQRHEYNCDDYLKKYGSHISEAHQRIATQEMVDRIRHSVAECKRANDCLRVANSVKELSNWTPICKKIAKEVMKTILQEYPKSNFPWAFKNVGLL